MANEDSRPVTTSLEAIDEQVAGLARQEIEYLRRWYARATDLLGQVSDPSALAEGLRIYHRIFTAEANIRVVGGLGEPKEAKGPDGWATVVQIALKDYESTQHLIGTQIVEISSLRTGVFGAVIAGEAHMESYLQAWHAWPDRQMRLVIGTYIDEVQFTLGTGWQIRDMTLSYTSSEKRLLGEPA